MSIIYNYNNHFSSHLKLGSSYWSRRRRRASGKYTFRELKNYLGQVKIFIIPLSLVAILAGYWLMLFGSNISLNYQIYQAKTNIAALEKEANLLRERAAEETSDQELAAWAQANGFTRVEKISYLPLENDRLALEK